MVVALVVVAAVAEKRFHLIRKTREWQKGGGRRGEGGWGVGAGSRGQGAGRKGGGSGRAEGGGGSGREEDGGGGGRRDELIQQWGQEIDAMRMAMLERRGQGRGI